MTSQDKYIYYVYITTNLINGKQYIGDHKINNKRTQYYLGSGNLLKLAIKKYGTSNFFKEILEWHDNRNDAYLSQQKYINELNTLKPNGYNISPLGGLGSSNCFSEETKNKMSISARLKKVSNETKKKQSIVRKGCTPWNKGLKNCFSESVIQSMSEKRKGNTYSLGYKHSKESIQKIIQAQYKKVIQYDLDGNYIREYLSPTIASLDLGISRMSIYNCIKNRQKTAHGFVWKYKNINNE